MNKKLKITILYSILALSFACHDEEKSFEACGVVDPAQNLPWMKTMIDSWEAQSTIYQYMYVQQGTYIGQTVFIAGNCCPFCDSYFPVFNCEGEELEGINWENVNNVKTIWKPLTSECTF